MVYTVEGVKRNKVAMIFFFFLSNGVGEESYSAWTCLEGLSREVMFQLRPEGWEGMSHLQTKGMSSPRRGNRTYKGPELGKSMGCGVAGRRVVWTGTGLWQSLSCRGGSGDCVKGLKASAVGGL